MKSVVTSSGSCGLNKQLDLDNNTILHRIARYYMVPSYMLSVERQSLIFKEEVIPGILLLSIFDTVQLVHSWSEVGRVTSESNFH